MTRRKNTGDFEIHLDAEDVPEARKHPPTTTLAAASPEARLQGPQPEEDQPEGGQIAIFRFSDGTRLEFAVPYAIGMGGGGDSQITEARWRLCKGDVVMNGGRLLDVMRAHAGFKEER